MLVRDTMIPNPLVVAPEDSVLEFCTKVLASNQTTAAVVDGDALVGVVSVADVFKRILPHYTELRRRLADLIHAEYFEEKFEEFKNTSVRSIMTTEVDTLGPGDAVIKAVGMLYHQHHKTIPVVEGGRYVGSITRRSVLVYVTQDRR